MFERILVPVDLAEPEMTELAINQALAFATPPKTEIRLVNVQSLPSPLFIEFAPLDLQRRALLAAEEQIERIAGKMNYPRRHISIAVRTGSVYDEALAEAEDWEADLIVVCSRRPGMRTYLMGSNSANIVRHAKCSVHVVRS